LLLKNELLNVWRATWTEYSPVTANINLTSWRFAIAQIALLTARALVALADNDRIE
jgi:hypothetical protein